MTISHMMPEPVAAGKARLYLFLLRNIGIFIDSANRECEVHTDQYHLLPCRVLPIGPDFTCTVEDLHLLVSSTDDHILFHTRTGPVISHFPTTVLALSAW